MKSRDIGQANYDDKPETLLEARLRQRGISTPNILLDTAYSQTTRDCSFKNKPRPPSLSKEPKHVKYQRTTRVA